VNPGSPTGGHGASLQCKSRLGSSSLRSSSLQRYALKDPEPRTTQSAMKVLNSTAFSFVYLRALRGGRFGEMSHYPRFCVQSSRNHRVINSLARCKGYPRGLSTLVLLGKARVYDSLTITRWRTTVRDRVGSPSSAVDRGQT